MKNRIVTFVLIVILMFALAVGLTGCSSGCEGVTIGEENTPCPQENNAQRRDSRCELCAAVQARVE